jgi:hypothetical protein
MSACPNEYLEHADVDATFHLETSSEIFISPMNKYVSNFGWFTLRYSMYDTKF